MAWLLSPCKENPLVTGRFPSQCGQYCAALVFSLLLSRTSYMEQRVKMTIWDAITLRWRQCFRNNCCQVTRWILNKRLTFCRWHSQMLCRREIIVWWWRYVIIWLDDDQTSSSLQWRHNERDGVSSHQRLDGLLNHLFRRRSKKTSKLRVTGLCEWNSPVTPQKGQ